jgi:outer membrane biosynthesis protein TonB
MRYGAIFSGLLHLVILIVVIVGIPGILQSDRPEIVPISVEVVSIEELAKQTEKKRPPRPVAKKPPPKQSPPKKPDPPKATKKPPPPPAPPKTPPPVAPKPLEVKPEPMPKPKAAPAPKPKAKPAPPKKLKTQVAAKTPPAPKPKRKPKPKPPPPKPDEFQSLLKNLAKDRRAAEKAKANAPVKVAKQAVETPRRSALQDRRIAAGLSQAINQQITPCWKIQAGARDAANMSVAVNIRLNPDGSLSGVTKIEDTVRLGRDPFFRAVAESAQRALRDPACMPLKLPYENYDLWKNIIFTFDPKEALGQ